MRFKLRPVLLEMEQLYRVPPSKERFERYLYKLQGNNKNDMILPIGGYNPMGNDHFSQKLNALIKLETEEIAANVLDEINDLLNEEPNQIFQVVINLADDVGGAWSHRYMTDYSTKFQITPLLKRNFCTPYFWTSEDFDQDLVTRRVQAYIYRTRFQSLYGSPITLENHLKQEIFVERNIGSAYNPEENYNLDRCKSFYEQHCKSEDYGLIFNFLYGDEISKSLGYKTYGCKKGESLQFILERTQA